jgi:hypothetical protein
MLVAQVVLLAFQKLFGTLKGLVGPLEFSQLLLALLKLNLVLLSLERCLLKLMYQVIRLSFVLGFDGLETAQLCRKICNFLLRVLNCLLLHGTQ